MVMEGMSKRGIVGLGQSDYEGLCRFFSVRIFAVSKFAGRSCSSVGYGESVL